MSTTTTTPKRETERQRRERAATTLRELCPPGTRVYTSLEHRARSGMARWVSLYVIHKGRNVNVTGYAATVLGARRSDAHNGGIRVDGCGMDMGFHLVYHLAATLYPTGHGCIGAGCPSNDHSNGDRDETPHRVRVHTGAMIDVHYDHWHTEGGYALTREWL